MKLGALAVAILFTANNLVAQTIEEGKKHLYYEKFASAKNVFQQLLNTNANNIEAAYWMGQAMLTDVDGQDIAGAKALYLKTLAANSNSALLLAGVGHAELLEGKLADAKNRFETAISLSQAKDPAVLNAVGFANADFDSKLGDGNYAVEKLKLATALKTGAKDPAIWANLGDAYRKLSDGGNALTAYETALKLNPTYARGYYRIGRIYQSQGSSQSDLFLTKYNEAIAADANYTPVYYTLQQYFYDINVTKSAEYLEKYLTAKGSDEKNACYLRTALLAAQGKYQETIAKADGCIAEAGGNADPRLFGIQAYQYDKLGDSVNAIAKFETFFAKQKAEKIGPADYEFYAKNLLKFPGKEALAASTIEQAAAVLTKEEEKVPLIKLMASTYEKRKMYADAAAWYRKVVAARKTPTNVDFYNAAYNSYRIGDYAAAAEGFKMYSEKYPADIIGHYLTAKSLYAIDTLMLAGTANPYFEKAIAVGEAGADKSKVKSQLMGSYKYFIAYNVNIKKDKEAALAICEKALLVDPTDAEILKYKEVIPQMNFAAGNATRPSTGTTTNTGTTVVPKTATTPKTGTTAKPPVKKN